MKTDAYSALLELNDWDALTPEARLATALAVAESLPHPFAFKRLERHRLGGQTHEVATFRFQESTFVLVPGRAAAELGYDRSRPFEPTPEQAGDWEFTQREYQVTLHEYLDHYLSP